MKQIAKASVVCCLVTIAALADDLASAVDQLNAAMRAAETHLEDAVDIERNLQDLQREREDADAQLDWSVGLSTKAETDTERTEVVRAIYRARGRARAVDRRAARTERRLHAALERVERSEIDIVSAQEHLRAVATETGVALPLLPPPPAAAELLPSPTPAAPAPAVAAPAVAAPTAAPETPIAGAPETTIAEAPAAEPLLAVIERAVMTSVAKVTPPPVAKVTPPPVAKVTPPPVAKVTPPVAAPAPPPIPEPEPEPPPEVEIAPPPVAKPAPEPPLFVEPAAPPAAKVVPPPDVEPVPPVAKVAPAAPVEVEPPPVAKVAPAAPVKVEPPPVTKVEPAAPVKPPKSVVAAPPKDIPKPQQAVNQEDTTDEILLFPLPDPSHLILDSFEALGTWATDPAFGAPGQLHTNNGLLNLSFEITQGPPKDKCAVTRLVKLDVAKHAAMIVDVDNRTPGMQLALALIADKIYYESKAQKLKPGLNPGCTFNLEEASFKSSDTQWNYRGALDRNARITKIFLLVYSKGAGEVGFANLRTVPIE